MTPGNNTRKEDAMDGLKKKKKKKRLWDEVDEETLRCILFLQQE